MKSVTSVLRFVPSVVVAFAVVSLYAFTQIDNIVNQTLYQYYLQFSYSWANPYWDMAHVLMAMSALIAGLSIAFQVYMLVPKKSLVDNKASQPELREEERLSTFRLGDGSTIKVKLIVKGAKRFEQVL